MRPRSMEEGKVGRARCASAADLAAERAVPETEEAEAVVLDDEGATTTEDCGRTLAAFIVCVSIAPDPIVSNCEALASSSTRCDAMRCDWLTCPVDGTPSTTRKIMAGPGWKMLAFGGICET